MPIVIASSFADPKDIAAYKKAIAEGKTEAEALKVGDNGIGKWGDNTARDDVPMCAFRLKIGLPNGAIMRVGKRFP